MSEEEAISFWHAADALYEEAARLRNEARRLDRLGSEIYDLAYELADGRQLADVCDRCSTLASCKVTGHKCVVAARA